MPDPQARCEFLPAQGQPRAELVLLHGWASSSACWRPVLAFLRMWANVTLIDWRPAAVSAVSAVANAGDDGLQSVLDDILALTPARAYYVGWSLGGQLATVLAARAPQRVAGLVTVASNPRFTADGSWPGVPPATLGGFQAGLAADAARTLRRFAVLQSQGGATAATLAREWVAQSADWSPSSLAIGLQWLAELDTRGLLPALTCPQQHLLAQCDGLVPEGAAEALSDLLANTPGASVQMLAGAPHAVPAQTPVALADALAVFVGAAHAGAALAGAAHADPAPVSKQAIAQSFSRAAPRYDSVAALQRDVGERLLRDIPSNDNASDGGTGESSSSGNSPATVLDLGCGTGFFQPHLMARYAGAAYLGLDLAQGMLAWARQQHPQGTVWVAGDAESLPLLEGSIDVIFSSLAFQWCYRPSVLFTELGRVLAPGGSCYFSSLGPATLQELRASWAAADGGQHVNDFLPAEVLQAVAAATQGARLTLRSERIVLRYRKVTELLHELKTLGAHNMNSQRPAGLTGRQRLAAMIQAYEDWREPEGLPATYDVIYGHLEKI